MRGSKKKSFEINKEAAWFGFEPVNPVRKKAKVAEVFHAVAPRYDVMNDLMSLGLHRLWKDYFVTIVHPRPGEALLDVAGGTGDIAFRLAERTHGRAKITVCDINPAMMAVGQARATDLGWLDCVNWVEGNAECLPFDKASFDKVTISFGLRNVPHIDDALASFARVLKPGGRFFCLEFSSGVSPWIKPLYDAYCTHVLPPLGQIVANDRGAYRYLAESIQQFPDQDELAARMERAGFEQVSVYNLMGGIAVLHTGWIL
jgi:demethylmenaquinone methyltransferase/2-methoxy-6-polyprenyl-1,4-benzoquinol methylase